MWRVSTPDGLVATYGGRQRGRSCRRRRSRRSDADLRLAPHGRTDPFGNRIEYEYLRDRAPWPAAVGSAVPGARALRRLPARRRPVPGLGDVRLRGAAGPVLRPPRRLRDPHPAALPADRGAHPSRRRRPALTHVRARLPRRPRPRRRTVGRRASSQRRVAAVPDPGRRPRRRPRRGTAAAGARLHRLRSRTPALPTARGGRRHAAADSLADDDFETVSTCSATACPTSCR